MKNECALVNVILTAQILTALIMIGLILVQHGKGADMGAAFGSGSSGSLFGASGSANFLSRSTAVLAAVFLSARWRWRILAIRARASSGSVLENAAVVAAPAAVIPACGQLGSSRRSAVPSAPVAASCRCCPDSDPNKGRTKLAALQVRSEGFSRVEF
jgi:preprotein translocase subunit SecG